MYTPQLIDTTRAKTLLYNASNPSDLSDIPSFDTEQFIDELNELAYHNSEYSLYSTAIEDVIDVLMRMLEDMEE